jgi:hypothetical protein
VARSFAVCGVPKWTIGEVDRYLPQGPDPTEDEALWHVRHEDGDEEDLDSGEMVAALALHDEYLQGKSASFAKQEQVVVVCTKCGKSRRLPPGIPTEALPQPWHCEGPPLYTPCSTPEAHGESPGPRSPTVTVEEIEVVCHGSGAAPISTYGTFDPTKKTIRCQCGCEEAMSVGSFEKHAGNRSRKPTETVKAVATGLPLGTTAFESRSILLPKAPAKTPPGKPDPWLAQASFDRESPCVGRELTVILHVVDTAKAFLFPVKGFTRFLQKCASSRDPKSDPVGPRGRSRSSRADRGDLGTISGESHEERTEKLNNYRDVMAAKVAKHDNVACATDDTWEGHQWWAAKVVKPLYTVQVPFRRGELDFEPGDRVLDLMWYDRDAAARVPNKGDTQFYLLDAVDTVFSYSIVDFKFELAEQIDPNVLEDEPIVPTYLLLKADSKAIDASVDEQEAALHNRLSGALEKTPPDNSKMSRMGCTYTCKKCKGPKSAPAAKCLHCSP